MDIWNSYIENFSLYLRIEKGLADNSVEAYVRDVEKLASFCTLNSIVNLPKDLTTNQIASFFDWLSDIGIGARSQARIISGIKAFYKQLVFEDIITDDPSELFETPRLSRHIPDVLEIDEIDLLIDAIDLSKNEGQRNRAILECLYSCGLRVSELCSMKLSNMYLKDGYIRITGKGRKERLVPISNKAIREIELYLENSRNHQDIKSGQEDILFLNRRGHQLTRVMIFTIVKGLVKEVGLIKNISPHTFRHSFATHLVDGGADLRAVQEMLGHESILTTEIYTHLDREHLRSEIEMFHPRSKSRLNK